MSPKHKSILFCLNLLAFILILKQFPENQDLAKGLAIFVFVALLWLFEVFHITITSLLIPLLASVMGVFAVEEALSHFASPILFLFMGGFALAAALHKYHLDSFIAANLIKIAKGRMLPSAILIFVLTAFLSMWISNTATVAIMLPLVLGILRHLDYAEHKPTYLFLLLGTAYSGSIGGMGTLIGSPPNAIAASEIGFSFSQWLVFGIPMVILTLPLMIGMLYVILRPKVEDRLDLVDVHFKLSSHSATVLAIFLFTVLCWVFSKSIGQFFEVKGSVDALIAISAIVMLSITRVLKWQELADSSDWGVLLLFGGGITLSAIMQATGASHFLAESISQLSQSVSILLFLLIVLAFVVFLTELTSNTASAALIIPIFVLVANRLGLDSELMAIVIAFAASCAFMLPVATPPNALVYATGYILQKDMLRVGLMMNLVMIAAIGGVAWYLIV